LLIDNHSGTFPLAFGREREGDLMNRAAVTFDFHNTLAQCDEWFDLEVKGLVSAFLRWQSADHDTSVDSQTLWSADEAYRQLRKAVQEHGNELTAEACVAAVLDELNLSYDDREIARGVEHLMLPKVDLAEPMPGAVETVQELANSGVPLGIVSSAVHHSFLEWSLDQFGILEAFETITTSASAGFYKSRTEVYFSALSALNAAPGRSVHVGDSQRFDVGGAQRAGMRTVWLSELQQPHPALAVPDLTLPNLVGSTPHILNLLNRDNLVIGPSITGVPQ
jgi:FMN phosphatase YigB (HAD superfamily)